MRGTEAAGASAIKHAAKIFGRNIFYCLFIKILPPVAAICRVGPPPLIGPSALKTEPRVVRRTGKSLTIVPAPPLQVAFNVTLTLDGINTVMSPPPVRRNERAGSRASKSDAMILPNDVVAITLPETPVSLMAPDAVSHRTPGADDTRIGPPELFAITTPAARPTSMGPPWVVAVTELPACPIRMLPAPVWARTGPQTSAA